MVSLSGNAADNLAAQHTGVTTTSPSQVGELPNADQKTSDTPKEEEAATNLPPPEIARNIPCRFYPLGTCKYGDKCAFSHTVPVGYPPIYLPVTEAGYYPYPTPYGYFPQPFYPPVAQSPEIVPETDGPPKSDTQSATASPQNVTSPLVPLPYPSFAGYPILSMPTPGADFVPSQMPQLPPDFVPSFYPRSGSSGVAAGNSQGKPRSSTTRGRGRGSYPGGFTTRSTYQRNGPKPPCAFFEANRCRHGDECAWVHALSDGTDARTLGKGMIGADGRTEGPEESGGMPRAWLENQNSRRGRGGYNSSYRGRRPRDEDEFQDAGTQKARAERSEASKVFSRDDFPALTRDVSRSTSSRPDSRQSNQPESATSSTTLVDPAQAPESVEPVKLTEETCEPREQASEDEFVLVSHPDEKHGSLGVSIPASKSMSFASAAAKGASTVVEKKVAISLQDKKKTIEMGESKITVSAAA